MDATAYKGEVIDIQDDQMRTEQGKKMKKRSHYKLRSQGTGIEAEQLE